MDVIFTHCLPVLLICVVASICIRFLAGGTDPNLSGCCCDFLPTATVIFVQFDLPHTPFTLPLYTYTFQYHLVAVWLLLPLPHSSCLRHYVEFPVVLRWVVRSYRCLRLNSPSLLRLCCCAVLLTLVGSCCRCLVVAGSFAVGQFNVVRLVPHTPPPRITAALVYFCWHSNFIYTFVVPTFRRYRLDSPSCVAFVVPTFFTPTFSHRS